MFSYQNVRRIKMNRLTESVKKLSKAFDLLMGDNFTTPIDQVMAKYPYIRHIY